MNLENATNTEGSSAAGAPLEERKPAKGDTVNVVTARGEHVTASVTNVRKSGLIDIEFQYRGQDVEITSVSFDKDGKKPDTWHWPAG